MDRHDVVAVAHELVSPEDALEVAEHAPESPELTLGFRECARRSPECARMFRESALGREESEHTLRNCALQFAEYTRVACQAPVLFDEASVALLLHDLVFETHELGLSSDGFVSAFSRTMLVVSLLELVAQLLGNANDEHVEVSMDDKPRRPAPSALFIDARPLEDILVDFESGATRGAARAKPGFDEAVHEIVTNQPKIGVNIGILQSQVDELIELNKKIELIASYIPAAKKLYELLTESLSYLDNRRHEIIRVVAKTVEAQAEAMKDESLLGKYEATRRYRSATAIKAAKTRKKKAAAANASTERSE